MMPSRGLQAVKGHAPRLFQLQCRNLSSASRIRPTAIKPTSLSLSSRPSQWNVISQLRTLPTYYAIRNASTQPLPSAAVPPLIDSDASTGSGPFQNLDTIVLDTPDIALLPEKIGYLHEIGLNYGWGPTSTIQWVLEHVHVYTGQPWWISIAATAILLRIAMFPLFLKSSDAQARTMALTSITKPISDKLNAAKKAGNNTEMMAYYQQLMSVRKRGGIRMRDQFMPLIVQGVFGYCGFKLIRAMSALPVPAMLTEGPGWLQDLTVSDPYLILPLAMGSSIHLLIRLGGEGGSMDSNAMNQNMRTFSLWVMPVIIMIGTGWLSAAVNIWFAAGGAFAIGQSLLLRQPAVRKLFGIAPLYKGTQTAAEQPAWVKKFLDNTGVVKPSATASTETESTVHRSSGTTWQQPKLQYVSPTKQPEFSGPVIDTTIVQKTTATPGSGKAPPAEPGRARTAGKKSRKG